MLVSFLFVASARNFLMMFGVDVFVKEGGGRSFCELISSAGVRYSVLKFSIGLVRCLVSGSLVRCGSGADSILC